jgi:hypothetical protein
MYYEKEIIYIKIDEKPLYVMQRKFIMVLPSAAGLGHLLLFFFDSMKWVILVFSEDGNTIIICPPCLHKCIHFYFLDFYGRS